MIPLRRWEVRDTVTEWVVRHLLPRRVIYWALIRAGSHATTGKWSSQIVPDLTLTDTIQRWEEPN